MTDTITLTSQIRVMQAGRVAAAKDDLNFLQDLRGKLPDNAGAARALIGWRIQMKQAALAAFERAGPEIEAACVPKHPSAK